MKNIQDIFWKAQLRVGTIMNSNCGKSNGDNINSRRKFSILD